MSLLIPQIDFKITKKLKELNLRPKVLPGGFIQKAAGKKHRYWSLCQTETKKEVVFYARLHNNKDARIKFKREIKFLKESKGKKFTFFRFVPKLIAAGIEKDYEWLIREYINGLPLGFSRKLKTKMSPKIAPILAKAIFRINQLEKEFFKDFGLKNFNWRYYLEIKDLYFGLLKKKIIDFKTYQGILKLLQDKNKKELLKKENHYFTHGDLNLGNIIFYKKGFKIIDWELIHLNNFVYDFAYCWTHLWQASKRFREKLVFNYLKLLPQKKRKIFKEILPIVVIYLALGGITYQARDKSKSYFIKRRKFYLKLLMKALHGFNELIKV